MKLKRVLPIFLLVAVLLLAACGHKNESSSQNIEPPSTSAPTAPMEESVDGTVVDASMNTIKIETEDSTQYLFGTEDAAVDAGEDGIVLGASVTIIYVGVLDSAQQMQPVVVVRVEVHDTPQKTLEGVVTNASHQWVHVTVSGGAQYGFDTTQAEIDIGPHGLILGDTVMVYYKGSLDDSQMDQAVEVVRVKVMQEPDGSFGGTVTDATMNTVTVKADNGTQYLFKTEGAHIETGPKGLIIGDVVTVYYAGMLNTGHEEQNVIVIRLVVEAEPPTPSSSSAAPPASSSPAPASSSQQPHTETLPGPAQAPPAPASSSQAAPPPASSSSQAPPAPSSQSPATQTLPGPASEPVPSQAPVTETMPGPASSQAAPPAPLQTLPPPPAPESHFVNGIVRQLDGSTLTVATADGGVYAFDISAASVDTAGGDLEVGDNVAVFYTGTLDDSAGLQPVSVSKVSISGWGGGMLTGTVVSSDGSTITIQIADGASIVFSLNGTNVQTGLDTGTAVNVYYLGDYAEGPDVQHVRVVKVTPA